MFSLTLMSKGEKRSGLDATFGDLSSLSGLPSMPKGEIVGMFTGRVCLSLMERKEGEAEGSIRSGGGVNNTHKSNLRRDSTLCFP
jgi:hypothetical protein